MKIAFSSTGKTMESILDMRFGRCLYFLIYNTDTQEVAVLENKGQLSGGGAGIAAAQQLLDEKVDVILTGNLGPNAHRIIHQAGIQAYYCEAITLNQVLEKYNSGELKQIITPGAAHQGMKQ